jgi:hypothetical protein
VAYCGLKTKGADPGAVTLIQRFGSAPDFNIIHFPMLVLDGGDLVGTRAAGVSVHGALGMSHGPGAKLVA